MTYDKQDLLLDLRKLAANPGEEAHGKADDALIRFIDDEHIAEAYRATYAGRWTP